MTMRRPEAAFPSSENFLFAAGSSDSRYSHVPKTLVWILLANPKIGDYKFLRPARPGFAGRPRKVMCMSRRPGNQNFPAAVENFCTAGGMATLLESADVSREEKKRGANAIFLMTLRFESAKGRFAPVHVNHRGVG